MAQTKHSAAEDILIITFREDCYTDCLFHFCLKKIKNKTNNKVATVACRLLRRVIPPRTKWRKVETERNSTTGAEAQPKMDIKPNQEVNQATYSCLLKRPVIVSYPQR